MTERASAFHPPFMLERFGRGRRSGLGRFWWATTGAIGDGMRLLRTAPPLGDVGTRGNDLTAWVVDWNRGGNPGDSNRE